MKTSSMLTLAIVTAAALALGVAVPDEAQAKARGQRPAARGQRPPAPPAARRAPARPAARRPQARHIVGHLPRAARSVWIRGRHYFVRGGVYYRPLRRGFEIVAAPAGAFVRALPRRHAVRRVGGRRYFRHGSTWYLRAPGRRGFMVVSRPV